MTTPTRTNHAGSAGKMAGIEREIGQIARGAGIGLGGNIVNYAVSYLFGILVARQIGADEWGLYQIGVTATSLISRIALFGLDRGLMRFAAISRGRGQGATLRRLSWLALATGGSAGILGGLAIWLFPTAILSILQESNREGLLPLMPFFAVAVPVMTLTGIAIAGTQAFRTMRYRALIVNVVQPLVKLIAALALLGVFGYTAMAPVLAFVIAQILGTLLAVVFFGRLTRNVPRTSERILGVERQLARFSAPLFLTNVLDYLNGRTEILVLGMFLVSGASGIYSAAGRLAGLGLIVLTAFNAIFSPLISDLHARGQLTELATLFKLVTRWIAAVAMPLFIVQMVFAPQFMSLFGADFVAGATALRILSLGQLLNFCTGSVGVMLMMSGRSDITFVNSIVTVILALILDFVLVPAYGLLGAAVAGAIIIGGVNLLRLSEVWLLMRIHPFSPAFVKPFLAALPASAMGLAWLRWLPLNHIGYLLAACIAVGLVYLAALLLLRLDDGDRMMLAALRTRALRMLPARFTA